MVCLLDLWKFFWMGFVMVLVKAFPMACPLGSLSGLILSAEELYAR